LRVRPRAEPSSAVNECQCIDQHSRTHAFLCGCGTHWETLGQDFGKMGVNARLLDGFDEAAVEVRKVDNAG
jgi:hypothetical protein